MQPSRAAHVRHVLQVSLVGFGLGALLGAPGLESLASRQPFGRERSLSLALVRPVAALSRALRLDRPRRFLSARLHPEDRPTAPLPARSPAARDAPSPSPTATAARGPLTARAPTARRTFTAARPLSLWIGGDSMAHVFGQELAALARQSGVVRATHDAHHATGLTRPDYFDWPARLRLLASRRRHDAVVLVFGANDAETIAWRGTVYGVGRPEWREAYRARVRAAMDLASGDGRAVYWVGMPVMRSPAFSRKMSILNGVYREESAAHEGVTFIDAWSRFTDAEGAYAAWLPDAEGRLRLVREVDGIHYTREGARRLAEHVFSLIRARFLGP